jgi:hypothetical protein
MNSHQKKRILQLAIPLLIGLAVVLILEHIHRGLGRAVFVVGPLSIAVYCFINDDKPWARQILNRPKSWWMD